VSLDQVAPPDLVIEIADSSLDADLGTKRLLYEAMGVREYWVVDVDNAEILAFQIANQGSQRINQSQVLTSLDLNQIETALTWSKQTVDNSEIVQRLMKVWIEG
jgi:Uma2 family endonuclease